MKKGIVFSHEEDTNELKVSRYDSDSLALILNVPLFDYDTSEFTDDAVGLAKELGFDLTTGLIHTGSPMDAVQDIWLNEKLEDFAENSNVNLDELLKTKPRGRKLLFDPSAWRRQTDVKELSNSELEALSISKKIVDDAIKRVT